MLLALVTSLIMPYQSLPSGCECITGQLELCLGLGVWIQSPIYSFVVRYTRVNVSDVKWT